MHQLCDKHFIVHVILDSHFHKLSTIIISFYLTTVSFFYRKNDKNDDFSGLENLIISKFSRVTELVCGEPECELRQLLTEIIIRALHP